MKKYVECWHCENYICLSVDDNNLIAICKIRNEYVLACGRVCDQFVLKKGTFTKCEIPNYCINHKK